MKLPKISIITPSFNQGVFIERTILSVIEQEYPEMEFIIIDGGSTDGSLEIIREYDDCIDYYVSEKDSGIADAWNKGLTCATGDIIGFLNADDFYSADTISTVVGTAGAHKKTGHPQRPGRCAKPVARLARDPGQCAGSGSGADGPPGELGGAGPRARRGV